MYVTKRNSPILDPIGYTANTVFHDVKYTMQIQQGEIGPKFVVSDEKRVFTGTSCTDVWSQICSERLLPRVNGVQVRRKRVVLLIRESRCLGLHMKWFRKL
jgi:hypothetical protein